MNNFFFVLKDWFLLLHRRIFFFKVETEKLRVKIKKKNIKSLKILVKTKMNFDLL